MHVVSNSAPTMMTEMNAEQFQVLNYGMYERLLGHSHYILRITDPGRGFSFMPEKIKVKV